MATIVEIRQKYPQYQDLSDGQLADALHDKFYSDMPREQFDQKIGLSAKTEAPKQQNAAAFPAVPRNIGATGSWNAGASGVAESGFMQDLQNAYEGRPDKSTKYGIVYPIARDPSGERRFAAPQILQEFAAILPEAQKAITGENYTVDDMMQGARDMARQVMGGGLVVGAVPKLGPPAGAIAMNALPRAAKSISRGITSVAQPLVDRFDPEGAIARTLAKRIQQQNPGMSLEDAIKTTEQRMQELGPDAVLADAGDATRGLADVMVQTPGESKSLARTVLGNRNASEGSRMVQSVKENVTDADFYDAKATNAASKRLAGPLYEQAKDNSPHVTSPFLRLQIKQEPLIRQGMNKGIELQRIEASAAGKEFNPEQFGIASFDDEGNVVLKDVESATPLRLWHAAREGLDSMLEAYRDPLTGVLNLDKRGRAIQDLRRSFNAELKSQVGGDNGLFAQADKIYADASKLEDAMKRGRRFVTGDEEITADVFNKLKPPEKEAYLAGVAREMQGMIRKAGATPTTIRNALKDTGIRDKLKAILPSEGQFNKFISDLQREETFKETNRIRYGSQTFGRGAEDAGATQDVVGNAVAAGAQAARGDLGGAAMSAVRSAQNFLKRAQLPQSTRDRIGKLLLSQDQADKDKAFELLRGVKSSGWVYSP